MRNNNEFEPDRDEDLFFLEKAAASNESKKAKPHVIRRNVEDYLERKALERRLKDIFDDGY